MNKFLVSLLFSVFVIAAYGQTQQPVMPTTQKYGVVDLADLKMTECDFEKDANAEILFDKAFIEPGRLRPMERHIRIKIFNDYAKKLANVRLIYRTEFFEAKTLADVEGETINLENNTAVITPIDKKQIYTEKINKNYSALIFTFPNVKAGSIIEYKYRADPPRIWYFQDELPTRYSEVETHDDPTFFIKANFYLRQPLAVDKGKVADTKQVRAMANVHSLPNEPFMSARRINLQRAEFFVAISSWNRIAGELVKSKYFGSKLDEKLAGEDDIYTKAKGLKSDDERIAFIFDTVKNSVKWDKKMFFLTPDDIATVWDKKLGNSAAINLILYHLLSTAGLSATPMIVSTIDFGAIDPVNPDPFSFNNTVVVVRMDSTKFYVLDASNKYNLYNTIPYNILNTYGLGLDLKKELYNFQPVEFNSPVTQSVFLNAEIKPDGKMAGDAEITSDSYNKITALTKYNIAGKEKYLDTLRNLDNNLKIASYTMENATVDSLPLTQKVAFILNPAAADENYIYLNTTVLSGLGDNPFKRESRYTDIDLGYRVNFIMSGVYKIPAGYKIDALPKSITTVMPDNSIVFKRIVAEDNGTILVKYSINHKKTVYPVEEYQDIRGFYKKMYELLNEQIVLKKI